MRTHPLRNGLRRWTSKHRPRAYCWMCTWSIPSTRDLSVDRVGQLARAHAREKGHRVRWLVTLVTEYGVEEPEVTEGRERLAAATAERTGRP